MRRLTRLPEPGVLQQNKARWLERFLASGDKRPLARQYGHREIRAALAAMSYHKCFYCETKLETGGEEVDHYVEVAEAPQRVFDWDNLCLACHGCNRRKRPNSAIPAVECLDPCGTDDPAAHLTFEAEMITAKGDSAKGLRTIQKYALDRSELSYLRLKALQQFERLLRQLHERRGTRALTEDEKEIIRRFKQPDHPFSLMFQVYLADVAL